VTYYFSPPTVDEGPAGDSRLMWRYKITRADTIIRNGDGSYSSYRAPGIDQLENASHFYQGGHIYPLTTQEYTDLTNAGYGAYITGGP
jgi:hypothetical protein